MLIFYYDTLPVLWIRIGSMTKNLKILVRKKFIFIYIKNCNIVIPRKSKLGYRGASCPQQKTSSTSEVRTSVPDQDPNQDPDPNPNPDPPDPHVFGPPRSGSGSTSQRYGSGSFYHHAKIVRKILIPTIFFLLFIFEKLCKCTFKK
jgi:hypothetical protein